MDFPPSSPSPRLHQPFLDQRKTAVPPASYPARNRDSPTLLPCHLPPVFCSRIHPCRLFHPSKNHVCASLCPWFPSHLIPPPQCTLVALAARLKAAPVLPIRSRASLGRPQSPRVLAGAGCIGLYRPRVCKVPSKIAPSYLHRVSGVLRPLANPPCPQRKYQNLLPLLLSSRPPIPPPPLRLLALPRPEPAGDCPHRRPGNPGDGSPRLLLSLSPPHRPLSS